MIKILSSNLLLFLGLSLVTYVELNDHSQVQDWRFYGLMTAFFLSILAFAASLIQAIKSRS